MDDEQRARIVWKEEPRRSRKHGVRGMNKNTCNNQQPWPGSRGQGGDALSVRIGDKEDDLNDEGDVGGNGLAEDKDDEGFGERRRGASHVTKHATIHHRARGFKDRGGERFLPDQW